MLTPMRQTLKSYTRNSPSMFVLYSTAIRVLIVLAVPSFSLRYPCRYWQQELKRKRRGLDPRLWMVIFKCLGWRIVIQGILFLYRVCMSTLKLECLTCKTSFNCTLCFKVAVNCSNRTPSSGPVAGWASRAAGLPHSVFQSAL